MSCSTWVWLLMTSARLCVSTNVRFLSRKHNCSKASPLLQVLDSFYGWTGFRSFRSFRSASTREYMRRSPFLGHLVRVFQCAGGKELSKYGHRQNNVSLSHFQYKSLKLEDQSPLFASCAPGEVQMLSSHFFSEQILQRCQQLSPPIRNYVEEQLLKFGRCKDCSFLIAAIG